MAVAHLRRARGIKGELIGESLTSHPERFQQLKQVLLRRGEAGETRELMVERVWDFRGAPVFKFATVDTMTDAEKLTGFDVCVPAAERVKVDEDEFFFADIVGCDAVAMQGGESYGRIDSWHEDAKQVWFEVTGADGKSFLVPFHRSIFCEIDVAAKVVKLDLPEGLRELN